MDFVCTIENLGVSLILNSLTMCLVKDGKIIRGASQMLTIEIFLMMCCIVKVERQYYISL